ncbi:hypothetical protein [Terrihabitans sp. B22-R8]|uniref:hypothetical protein n=1 Tax=Terrihabitans sp. B22-R8 TaxID=3425128 RepID=UPI00403C29A1
MNSFSPIHWLITILTLVVMIVPFWKIFPRAGLPAVLSLVMALPLVNIIMLWFVAFKRWPGDQIGSSR